MTKFTGFFKAIENINMNSKFIEWTIFLFTNVFAAINLNGNPGHNLKIEREVRQGCPIAPHICS